jgi:hypothetical protein
MICLFGMLGSWYVQEQQQQQQQQQKHTTTKTKIIKNSVPIRNGIGPTPIITLGGIMVPLRWRT